jgi:uncharacterized membrane protein YkgB
MQKRNLYIIITVIGLIIITAVIYLFIQKFWLSDSDALSEIVVYSPYENSSIVLYNKQDTQYVIQATSEQSANFQNLPSGTYMVSVAIENSRTCPFTQVIDLKQKEQIVVQAEIDQNNLCLD